MRRGAWPCRAAVAAAALAVSCPGVALAAQAPGAIGGHVTTAAATGTCVLVLDAHGQAVTAAATDSAGDYTAGGVPAGSWTVEFLPDNGCVGSDTADAFQYYAGAATPGTATPVTVTAGHTTPGIDATLTAGATVKGSVQSVAGQPLPGVCVLLEDGAGNPVVRQPTDTDGGYTIDQIPAGRFTLRFVDDGCVGRTARYASSYLGGSSTLAGATMLDLGAGEVAGRLNATLDALAPSGTTGSTGTTGTGTPGAGGPGRTVPTAPGSPPGPAAHAHARAIVTLLAAAGGRWTVDRRGRLHLRLRCAPRGPSCRVTAVASRVRRRGPRLIAGERAGARTLTIRAGRTRTALIPLRGVHAGPLYLVVRGGDGRVMVRTVVSVRWPSRRSQ